LSWGGWRILRCRKGISPLLATIMLIAITLAGGLLVYNFFFSTAGVLGGSVNVQVVSVDVVKTSTTTLVSATVKNTGNKPITSCTIQVWGDSGAATLNLGAMEPGQTKSAVLPNPSGLSVTTGKAYPVQIHVEAADGSTLDKTMTVTCTG
jgi:flagellin-like protein